MTQITHLIPRLDSPMNLREAKLRRELDIVRRARTDGAENLPARDDRDLNEAQLETVTACERALDDVRQWLSHRLRGAAEAADQAEPTPEERDFESPLEDTRLALTKLRAESREEMISTRLEERRHHRERAVFRRDNQLSRSADYPDVRLYAIGWITLILSLETWLNARVFAEASDFGLVGGGLMALLVSLPNVAIGLLVVGLFGLRYLQHVGWGWRLAGAGATLLGVAVIGFHNLYFAHYRVLLETNPDAPLLDALGQLTETPLAFLGEKDAWLLFLAGIIAALIATWKGFTGLTDRYPGYARVDRRYQAACRAYEGAKRRYRDTVHRLVADSITIIDGRIAAIERRFRKVSKIINRGHVDVRTAEQAAQENARVCARVIKTYRDENRRVRTTPPPAYFGDAPFLETGAGDPPAFDLEGKRGLLHQRVDGTRSAARDAKAELRRMAETETEDMFALVEAIESEADRRVQADEADDAARSLPSPVPYHEAAE